VGTSFAGSPRPGQYEEPGYLPLVTDGPFLLLSDDGNQLAYNEHGNGEETFLVPVGQPTAVQHVTADALFNPYIDHGVFFRFAGTKLTFGYGDLPDRIDVYAATAGPGGPVVRNVTLTSKVAQPPFQGGATLFPQGVMTGPGGTLLLVDKQAGGERLLAIDPVT
jgi:hypothetical protein